MDMPSTSGETCHPRLLSKAQRLQIRSFHNRGYLRPWDDIPSTSCVPGWPGATWLWSPVRAAPGWLMWDAQGNVRDRCGVVV